MVGMGLGHPGGHGAHPDLGHQLHRDACPGIDVLQVVDELGQIFNRVDVVMRRRGDEPHARGGVAHSGDLLTDLVAGKLAPLAGLGALGHLDLDVVGIDQVLGGDAEAPGGHLLDRRALGVRGAIGLGLKALWLLAALAGVGLAAQAVHGHRQGGMGLLGDGAEGHGAGGEALHDLLRRLDLVQGHRLVVQGQLEQTTEGQQALVLVVDRPGEGFIAFPVIGPAGMLELRDGVRGPGVGLAADAEGIIAADVQGVFIEGIGAEGVGVPAHRLGGDLAQADALDPASGAGEVVGDKIAGQADGVEDLGAAIGLIGGDAHFGHDLEQTLLHRLDIAPVQFGLAEALRQLGPQGGEGVEGQVGVDGLGAIAGQHRKMVDLPRRPGLDHQTGLGPQSHAHQVVVDGGHRQQGRDGQVVGIHPPVGEHQDVEAVAHRLLRRGAQ